MGFEGNENYLDASCGFGVVTVCKTVMTVADELYRSVTSFGLGLTISNTDTNNGNKKTHTYFPLKVSHDCCSFTRYAENVQTLTYFFYE